MHRSDLQPRWTPVFAGKLFRFRAVSDTSGFVFRFVPDDFAERCVSGWAGTQTETEKRKCGGLSLGLVRVRRLFHTVVSWYDGGEEDQGRDWKA